LDSNLINSRVPVQFDHLFNKVWDMVISESYTLKERTFPTDLQILSSWNILKNKLIDE
jgi:hypothetical protein